ncbi:MAG: Asp23/Gls24 family envelope stress response protein [Oscillospiraceae bacterium]|nr:Asp23/Gls24 family envelope stress response protein [Oscillospiraceae bacterium]
MAENKQYVMQSQDNGSICISEDVVAAIVAHAAAEVEGVVSLNAKPGTDIVELVGKKTSGKGIKITVLEDNSVAIYCNVNVSYGQSIISVAGAVQSAIINALESMAGIKIASVNVNVCGIVRQ